MLKDLLVALRFVVKVLWVSLLVVWGLAVCAFGIVGGVLVLVVVVAAFGLLGTHALLVVLMAPGVSVWFLVLGGFLTFGGIMGVAACIRIAAAGLRTVGSSIKWFVI